MAEFRAKGYLPEALVNYLALIGWSPRRTATSCCRSTSWRGGSRSSDVGHSAGVFDEEKLAWVNRHYLKMAEPDAAGRAVAAVLPSAPASTMTPDAAGLEFLAVGDADCVGVGRSAGSGAGAAGVLFDYDAGAVAGRRRRRARRCAADGARAVVAGAGRASSPTAPRLDRERFRAVANQVKARTGQKGKALFHPIRVALTGRAEGPELDLAVPAIDRGAELPRGAGMPRSSAAASAPRRSSRALDDEADRDMHDTARCTQRHDQDSGSCRS